jgi:hypothetical protein
MPKTSGDWRPHGCGHSPARGGAICCGKRDPASSVVSRRFRRRGLSRRRSRGSSPAAPVSVSVALAIGPAASTTAHCVSHRDALAHRLAHQSKTTCKLPFFEVFKIGQTGVVPSVGRFDSCAAPLASPDQRTIRRAFGATRTCRPNRSPTSTRHSTSRGMLCDLQSRAATPDDTGPLS